jgi:hypothetical protein
VIGPDGEVEAVAGTTRDVTERKQTIDDLTAAKNGLAAQLADMKRLHEFNRLTLEQDDLNVILRELLVQVAGLMQAVKGSVQLREGRKGCFAWLPRLGLTAILSTVSNSSRQAALRFAPPLSTAANAFSLRTLPPIRISSGLLKSLSLTAFVEHSRPLCSAGQARSSLC